MALKLSNISVLVAEDNLAIRQLVCAVLKELGFGSITTAVDGGEAFEKFKAGSHDIIISDWEMQPVNGLEFLKNVRKSPLSPDFMVPFILLTGYAAPKRVKESRDLGMTEFVAKPFTVDQLSKRITHVINKPRDFIESGQFLGPDRRRSGRSGYNGEDRRKNKPDPS